MPIFTQSAFIAENIAGKADFQKEYVDAAGFVLMTYQKFKGPSENIRIYIEGDGKAWKTKRVLSDDPTPSSPIALQMAAVDTSNNVAYVARPGQFPAPGSSNCNPTYWSVRRFAPEVVSSINKVIDVLKEKSGTRHVELTGYSGGGALAVLIAAQRNDVIALRTVAGNLNSKMLCDYHRVSRLGGSMDPIDFAQKVKNIPQRHFIGSKDKTVPFAIAESFVKEEGDTDYRRITIVNGVTHNCGWAARWVKLLSMPLDAGPKE
ncbi:MAG: alpha/beta hydrolase [Candidatus Omnitrophota bacterium]